MLSGLFEGLFHQRLKAAGVGGQRALPQTAVGVDLYVQYLGEVWRLGLKQVRVVRGQSVQPEAVKARLFHIAGIGALGGQYALVQGKVIDPGALLVALSGGRGQIDGQLEAQPVPGLVQRQRLSAALVVDHPQIAALGPFVDAVDPSFQRARSAHCVDRQPGHAVLDAKVRLQRGGGKAAAPHVLGQHGGAGPRRSLQSPALGQGHGAVPQGTLAGHRFQQPFGDAVHAPSGFIVVQSVQILHAGQQEFMHGVVKEGALILYGQLEGFDALRAQPVAGVIGKGTPGVKLQPGYALAAQGAIQRVRRFGVQRVGALASAQGRADLAQRAARAVADQFLSDLPETCQSGGIPGPGGFPLGNRRQGSGCPGGGCLGRAAQHPLHAIVVRDAAAYRQRREYALQQRQQRPGVLSAAVQSAEGGADAQVFPGHLHRGLQVEAPHAGQLHAVRTQPGSGEARKGLHLCGVQQPVGVRDRPVGLAQYQQRLRPLGDDAVRGLGVYGIPGLGQGLDDGGVQRFRQGLAQLGDGQGPFAHQLRHLVQRADDAVPHLPLLAGLFPEPAFTQRVHPLTQSVRRADVLQEAIDSRQLVLQDP